MNKKQRQRHHKILGAQTTDILAIILEYARKGYMPSVGQIARKSTLSHSGIRYHIRTLHKKGYLQRTGIDGVSLSHEMWREANRR